MASRRTGKAVRNVFGESGPVSPEDAAALIYGDGEMVDGLDAQRVKLGIVDPRSIVIDATIQVRVKGLNLDRVLALMEVLLNGGQFEDPIDTCLEAEREVLAAGAHRLAAYLRALEDPRVVGGEIVLKPLMRRLHPGGREAALGIAEDDNLMHGEPLSLEDKRHLFYRRLARGHLWFSEGWSNSMIAAQLMVSEGTIRNWRKSFSPSLRKSTKSGENEGKLPPSQIITKSGRQMDTSRIGQTAKRRAAHKSKPPVRSFVPDGDPAPAEDGRAPDRLEGMRPAVPTGKFAHPVNEPLDSGTTASSTGVEFSTPDFTWAGSEASVLSALLQDVFGLNRAQLESDCTQMSQKAADRLRREVHDAVLLLQQWEGWLQ